MVRKCGVALALVFALGGGRLSAQEWAEKMFNATDHDFGTVARGADTVYKFEITNLYKQDMHITGVRSSCGCTSPSIENGDIVKTHEKAYIVARFNTRTHVGQRAATLTVTLGAPYAAEVQLHVHGNIRGDVVFNPGAVEFGDVTEGQPKDEEVAVEYAGRDDWQITDVTNDNDNFEVELKEAQRAAGRVSYKLVVRMKPVLPTGYVKDQLTVVTNDTRPENQRIPLIISGRVKPEFSVTPEQLVLGELESGKQLTKKIIVRGAEPFKIVKVSCGEQDCFEFKTDDEARTVHFVEVTFRAGEAPGKIQTPIEIVTDRASRGAKCMASATVIAAKPVVPTTPPAAAPEGASKGEASKQEDSVRTAATP